MWFPGVHSNIGGGYDNKGLSDVALAWMIARVQETGLRFDDDEVMRTVWPCTAATLYRSSKGGAFTAARNILPGEVSLVRSRLRRIGRRLKGAKSEVRIRRIDEKLHWGVPERCAWPTTLVEGLGEQKYKPANLKKLTSDVASPTALEEAGEQPQPGLDRQMPSAGQRRGMCVREARRQRSSVRTRGCINNNPHARACRMHSSLSATRRWTATAPPSAAITLPTRARICARCRTTSVTRIQAHRSLHPCCRHRFEGLWK